MTDYFALLQQPRRPWLDPEQLKQKFQQLALATHPDRGPTGPSLDFAEINEAYRVLSDPKQRLRHLLSLEGHDPSAHQSLPGELGLLFGKVGSFAQEADGLLEKVRSANTALSKSILRSAILKAQHRAGELVHELQDLYDKATRELQGLDAIWNDGPQEQSDDLTKLHHRFAYLGRWIEQLREAQFQLSV